MLTGIKPKPHHSLKGFTIVELLIVIVVIAILAAITIVAYNGVSNNARISAIQSNLSQMAKGIEVYKIQNSDVYPLSLSAGNVRTPDTGTYNYQSSSTAYCLSVTQDGMSYKVTSTTPRPTEGTCLGALATGETCPIGFIAVPGNSSLGTNEFCVMKYEARNAGSNVPVSQASGTPWASISQTNAITYSANVSGCTGCHLMTEAEWMTLAANVLSVPSNWSGGAVGSGYIFSGHNDNSPANAITASTDDDDGYNSTGQTSGNQRRTLTLTNGEVIWDLAGNVWEWTQGTVAGNQQPGLATDAGYVWKQWNDGSMLWGALPTSSRPSALVSSPELSNINSWTSTNGIGQLYSNYASTDTTRALLRSGSWLGTTGAGVLTLHTGSAPSSASPLIGFRVAR